MCYAEQKKSDNVKYNIRAANFDMMRETLSKVDWLSLLSPLNTNDTWSFFKSIFQKVIDDIISPRTSQETRKMCILTLKHSQK